MSDIRVRQGKKGKTYQVRYSTAKTKSGYAYATFSTLKEAKDYRDNSYSLKHAGPVDRSIRTVDQGVLKWLEVCEKEGRDGRDAVTAGTLRDYEYRAAIMKEYEWAKPLAELTTPDIIEFRSWLLRTCSRDQAKKVLSSLHAVIREMALRGHISSNVASGISIRAESRYSEPVAVPSLQDIHALLTAADRLANARNRHIAKVWERYRPMLYLAADTGMRPQEYLVIPKSNLIDQGVKIDRALERGDEKISVPKSPAGRRYIEVRPDTFDMLNHYAKKAAASKHDLVFPTKSGNWQSIDNWRNRGFGAACLEAGLVDTVEVEGNPVEKPRYAPYDLRHFFASMLIEHRVNLKRIQKLMGHADISTTLNVYGHLLEEADDENSSLSVPRKKRSGKSVAAIPQAAVKYGVSSVS